MKYTLFSFIIVPVLLLGAGCTDQPVPSALTGEKIDDWEYTGDLYDSDNVKKFGVPFTSTSAPMGDLGMLQESIANDTIGLSAGGAEDANNFRENIKKNFLPLPTDITHEGIYSEYFFDTGEQKECESLFCPSYTTAISKNPLTDDVEQYVSVGLNSGIKEEDFARKKLNLVVVMDISGSMGSPFDEYYYDQFGNYVPLEDYEKLSKEERTKTKMQIANESVVALTKHLNDDDRFGMVLFDDVGYRAKPLRSVGETNMDAIQKHILELQEQGGTNMEAGYTEGTALFEEFKDSDPNEYENRIIFITDAQPNTGVTDEGGLAKLTEQNANEKIYTSFIGVGVDFNTELVEAMTKVRGANYYSVHSAPEFAKRMDEQFDYMVTPLVFNLALTVDAEGYDIEEVYGSPEADLASGEIMKVNTLFPSEKVEGETKGGIVLLKLKKTGENPSLRLTASYEDRVGEVSSTTADISFDPQFVREGEEYYDNTGIRKAIALSRYVNLMKNWTIDEHESVTETYPDAPSPLPIMINPETCFRAPEPIPDATLSEWERQSVPLTVAGYEEVFGDFKKYMESEKEELDDEDLKKEIEILEKLTGR